MSAASICAAAAALFGPHWTRPELAAALDWDLRNVQRWCSGQKPIDPKARLRLFALLRERHIDLGAILAEFEYA